MDQPFRDYNETDILYLLMTYVNFSSGQDMYYSIAKTILTHLEQIPSISINDLAELCYTSPATISRIRNILWIKSMMIQKNHWN